MRLLPLIKITKFTAIFIMATMTFMGPKIATADPIEIETAAGPVTIKTAPTRLAVYDIAALDILSALGVLVIAAPENVYVPYLDNYVAKATPAGTIFEPNYETLAGLNPDLIIAGSRTSRLLPQLGRVAQTIDMTIRGDHQIHEGLARLATLGDLTGTQEKAAQLTAQFHEKLATARAAINGKGDALIILTNGPKISAFGKASRFGWLHTEIGIPEAHENVTPLPHGEAVSFEFIAQTNPDWLIVIDRGAAIGAEGEGAYATLNNALVQTTNAWKNGHVIYVSPAEMYVAGGGIRAMSRTMDDLIIAFSK